MMDYKEMATPMASNLKLLNDASSETVDAMMYRRMIGKMDSTKDMVRRDG